MKSFNQILVASRGVAEEHPDAVFIGGVAVYLHAMNSPQAQQIAEASHDVDFLMPLSGWSDLRFTDEVTSNKRLRKHQLIRDGIEFDVYLERNNDLKVPYDEAFAHSVTYQGMRVAALEHLLILKLYAYLDRRNSSKGDKDARDLVTISQVADGKVRRSLIEPYLRDNLIEVLEHVEASPVFTQISKGNAQRAKALRLAFSDFVAKVVGVKPKKRKR